MTQAAGAARSFPLVCFSADAFNFYPVWCCDTRGKPESARKTEENKKGVMEPWVKYWFGTIQGESTAILYSLIWHKLSHLCSVDSKPLWPWCSSSRQMKWKLQAIFPRIILKERIKLSYPTDLSGSMDPNYKMISLIIHPYSCEQFSLNLLPVLHYSLLLKK